MTRMYKTPIVLLLLAGLLSSCSIFRDRNPEYLASEEGKPLAVPEDLSAPRQINPMLIRVEQMRKPEGDTLEFLPPRAAVTAGGGEANAYMAWSASGAYLAVKDTPDSVARRTRFAIQRSGMNLIQQDDENGHQFEYRHTPLPLEKSFFQKVMFWRNESGPDYSGTYQLKFLEDGEETRVYLNRADGSGVTAGVAEHVLGMFMERLG